MYIKIKPQALNKIEIILLHLIQMYLLNNIRIIRDSFRNITKFKFQKVEVAFLFCNQQNN